jgi:hypothetical protein
MQLTTGTVVDGKIVVQGPPLAEGAVVAILSKEPETPYALTAADEDELLAAVAEIDRGEFLSAETLLDSLRKHG